MTTQNESKPGSPLPTNAAKHRLFLIDVSAFIFRAFFAIPKLSTSQGHPTNATYGFLSMLSNVIEKYRPEALICVFDSKEPSFRKDLYKEYKSNRGAPPDLLLPQFEDIRRGVELLGLAPMVYPGFEADDLIGALAKKFSDCDVVIVSGDKDLMQMVDDRVKMLDTMKDIMYGPADVEAKLGVPPSLVTDYLGLIGDSSDNIPGVPGIGPKTATELLKEHGSLEAVLAAAPSMKGKRKETLLANADLALLSKKLATVECQIEDGPMETIVWDDLAIPTTYSAEFGQFLRDLELTSLVKKFGFQAVVSNGSDIQQGGAVVQVAANPGQSHCIQTKEQWKQCLDALESCNIISFDTETRGEKTRHIEMVGLSLSGDGEKAFYIPLRHQGVGAQLPVGEVLEALQPLLLRKTTVAQNLKYDLKVLMTEGLHLESKHREGFFDTLIAHYLVDPEEKHGLDVLSQKYLGLPTGDFKTVLGDRADFSEVPLEQATEYAGTDAWVTRRLYEPLFEELKRKEQCDLFYDIEMPVAFVLADMEWTGIAVDPTVLNQLSHEYSQELELLQASIYASAGSTFNLNSPKQLSEILFNKLGLPVIRKTKTGFSTDVDVLEKLALFHEVPAQIVRYRELTKLKSTYVDVLPDLIEKDGRIHAQFNQTVAATGRLSSSNPNLQNIPVKTLSGRKIRKAFVPAPGNVFVGADYSQVELRLVAHLSQDPALVEAFQEGKDVHQLTAAEIFHIGASQVTSEQRSVAKAINFGLIYGKTAFGLAQELGISRTEAQSYIDRYFVRYRGVKTFMEKCLEEARTTGEVKTLFGRKRAIRDIHSKNVGVRNNAERMAMNTPVQGTAADIMKIAMIRVANRCKNLKSHLVLQVHDELILDVPQSESADVVALLSEEMRGAAKLSVPLDVNAGIADNWMDV